MTDFTPSDESAPADSTENNARSDNEVDQTLRAALRGRTSYAAASLDIETALQAASDTASPSPVSPSSDGRSKLGLPWLASGIAGVAAVVLITLVALGGLQLNETSQPLGIVAPTPAPDSSSTREPAPDGGERWSVIERAADVCITKYYTALSSFTMQKGDQQRQWSHGCNGNVERRNNDEEGGPVLINVEVRFDESYVAAAERIRTDSQLDITADRPVQIDGQAARHLLASVNQPNGSQHEVEIVVIDLGDATMFAQASSEALRADEEFDEVRAIFDYFVSELRVRPVVCGVPHGYAPIDFDNDGVDEWAGTTERWARAWFVEILHTVPGETCTREVAATGTSFASAGSPQGFGCGTHIDGSTTFVDWTSQPGAYLTSDGTAPQYVGRIRSTTTRFIGSQPTSETMEHWGFSDWGEELDNCVPPADLDDAERAGWEANQRDNSLVAPSANGCINTRWTLHSTPAALQPDGETDGDLRCDLFPHVFPTELQCDCTDSLEIRYRPGATWQQVEGTVTDDLTVDGYPARIVEQFKTDGDADQDRAHQGGGIYRYEVDTGPGLLEIEVDSTESALAIPRVAYLAGRIKILDGAPLDRLCAAVPERRALGRVLYPDFDGDGISEAMVPVELEWEPGTQETPGTARYTHEVLRSDGACGWIPVDGLLAQVVQDPTRTWYCNEAGQLVTAENLEEDAYRPFQVGNPVVWNLGPDGFVLATDKIPPGLEDGRFECDQVTSE